MKQLFAGVVIGLMLSGAIAFAKPERIKNVAAINKKQAIDEELGDIDALIQAIDDANSVNDLKPILKKILGAQLIESGKKKDKKDK